DIVTVLVVNVVGSRTGVTIFPYTTLFRSTDVDDGHVLSYSVVGSPPAGFTLNPDGSWSLDAANAAYQHLAAGATTDVVVTYQVSDGLGGTDTATLTITVTGVNDAPDAVNDVGSGTEDTTILGTVEIGRAHV